MNQNVKNEALELLDTSIDTYKAYPIPKVTYFDLNPLYKNKELLKKVVRLCIDKVSELKYQNQSALLPHIDYIACIESRGFIIGSILANIFKKGIVLLRSKPGRLPGTTTLIKHTLEYGDAQMEVQNGVGKVLIFDDVLATGGTSQAATDLLIKAGYTPLHALFLLELTYCNPSLSKIGYDSLLVKEEDPYTYTKAKPKAKPKAKAKPKSKTSKKKTTKKKTTKSKVNILEVSEDAK